MKPVSLLEGRVRVEFRGTIEVGPWRNRRVNGYAVVVDGKARQPFLPLRAANREAREVAREIAAFVECEPHGQDTGD